jgi:UDP-N-acetylmuramoyl-tripeptide--D-alanyl-D-alanine ligase
MNEYETLAIFVTNVIFVTTLGWYLITNLQWYNYKISRVILKHHKPQWHLFYFIIPFIAYYTTGIFFLIFFYFAVLPSIFLWHKKLDRRLVLTWRVKRFLILLVFLTLFQNVICTVKDVCETYGVFLPLAVAYIGSYIIEKYLFLTFKKNATAKLDSMKDLKIIAITGSYGKTSIKNFLTQILAKKYKVYSTPRSVNTLGGIISDVNNSLLTDAQIYICEAGARENGDIYEITNFLKPQTVIVGKVGLAHIEYFKTLENIIRTKLEIIQSPRLEKAFVYKNVTSEQHEKVEFFGDDIKNIEATLDGTDFEYKGEKFHTDVLGSFQAINIEVAIKVASAYGMSDEEIKKAVSELKPISHRLELIKANGKMILDDGYNGNIDGMLESIRLCSLHHGGNKVIVTPGLIESSEELNLQLCNAINDVFDIVIVTGKLNSELFDKNINVRQKTILHDKSRLTDILGSQTKGGDIILFANDAPSFI